MHVLPERGMAYRYYREGDRFFGCAGDTVYTHGVCEGYR